MDEWVDGCKVMIIIQYRFPFSQLYLAFRNVPQTSQVLRFHHDSEIRCKHSKDGNDLDVCRLFFSRPVFFPIDVINPDSKFIMMVKLVNEYRWIKDFTALPLFADISVVRSFI